MDVVVVEVEEEEEEEENKVRLNRYPLCFAFLRWPGAGGIFLMVYSGFICCTGWLAAGLNGGTMRISISYRRTHAI